MALFKYFPVLSRVLFFCLLPLLIVAAIAGYNLVHRALPSTEEAVSLTWKGAVVTLERGIHGISFMEGENVQSVHFAMGYAHAQDRLWQLELQRRLSQGTLSELFGKSAVEQDIWMRTLGIYHAAERSMPYLSEDALSSLEAYAAGINAWLGEGHQLPIEFSVFGLQPAAWKKVDSLAWIKVFALNLASNYNSELQAFASLKYLSPEKRVTFFPELSISEELSYQQPSKMDLKRELSTLFAKSEALSETYKIGRPNAGSNAWVVSGKYTDTGLPILASDPHLGLQLPSLWYAVRQKSPDFSLSGMSLVGLPVVIFGQNNHIAWGGTNMMADVQDSYIETINPNNPRQYWSDNGWTDFAIHEEIIKVKADFPSNLRPNLEPIKVMIRETERGPLVSDNESASDMPLSLRWTALDNDDTSYDSFYQINFATNWDEFTQALAYHKAPALNMLYADSAGNIGFQGIGAIPVRSQGTGALPVPVASGSSWLGYIPFEHMPRQFNPKVGYLLNANNQNFDEDYPYFISHHFANPARAKRIEALLTSQINAKKSIDADFMQKMQTDVVDLSVTELLTVFQQVEVTDKRQLQAINQLRQWQGSADSDSVGATLYYSWYRQLHKFMFADELQGVWNRTVESQVLQSLSYRVSPRDLAVLIDGDSSWCDDVKTSVPEQCQDILQNSLAAMLDEMTSLLGDDISSWAWGEIHHVLYQHQPFSEINGVRSLFERRYATKGSANTLNVAAGGFDDKKGYRKDFGAGFRQVISFSKAGATHYLMNTTGQSGQVGSKFYDDMATMFEAGQYISITPPIQVESKTQQNQVVRY